MLAVAMLALPFLVVVVSYHGLQASLPFVLEADERNSHYPIIRQFAADWPHMDLASYPSVTTPFFHLLMAGIALLVGDELYKLRLVQTLICLGSVLAFYRLLRVHFRQSPPFACLQALAMGLVPYFFVTSFVLMTDGLSWLLVISALASTLRLADTRSVRDQVLTAALFGLAVLTRQSSITLLPLILIMLGARWGWRDGRLLGVTATLMLALLPFAWLVTLWRGTVPIMMRETYVAATWNPTAFTFMLALVGLYLPFHVPGLAAGSPGLWSWLVERRLLMLIAAALAAGLLLVWPMQYTSRDFGVLWRLTAYVPQFIGTSLLFWGLLPLGLFTLLEAARQAARGGSWLPVAFLVLHGLPYIHSGVITQRHFDPAVIIFFALAMSSRTTSPGRGARLSLGVLCAVALAFDAMRFVLDM